MQLRTPRYQSATYIRPAAPRSSVESRPDPDPCVRPEVKAGGDEGDALARLCNGSESRTPTPGSGTALASGCTACPAGESVPSSRIAAIGFVEPSVSAFVTGPRRLPGSRPSDAVPRGVFARRGDASGDGLGSGLRLDWLCVPRLLDRRVRDVANAPPRTPVMCDARRIRFLRWAENACARSALNSLSSRIPRCDTRDTPRVRPQYVTSRHNGVTPARAECGSRGPRWGGASSSPPTLSDSSTTRDAVGSQRHLVATLWA